MRVVGLHHKVADVGVVQATSACLPRQLLTIFRPNCTLSMCRKHEVTICAFLAPQVLFMTIPVVGPIIFVPMQGAAAWLVALLAKQTGDRPAAPSVFDTSAAPMPASAQYNTNASSRVATPTAPTLPASAPVYPGHGRDQHPGYQLGSQWQS